MPVRDAVRPKVAGGLGPTTDPPGLPGCCSLKRTEKEFATIRPVGNNERAAWLPRRRSACRRGSALPQAPRRG